MPQNATVLSVREQPLLDLLGEVGPLPILQQGQQCSPGGGLLPVAQQPVDHHVLAAGLRTALAVLSLNQRQLGPHLVKVEVDAKRLPFRGQGLDDLNLLSRPGLEHCEVS